MIDTEAHLPQGARLHHRLGYTVTLALVQVRQACQIGVHFLPPLHSPRIERAADSSVLQMSEQEGRENSDLGREGKAL